jgi:hypothetical protein
LGGYEIRKICDTNVNGLFVTIPTQDVADAVKYCQSLNIPIVSLGQETDFSKNLDILYRLGEFKKAAQEDDSIYYYQGYLATSLLTCKFAATGHSARAILHGLSHTHRIGSSTTSDFAESKERLVDKILSKPVGLSSWTPSAMEMTCETNVFQVCDSRDSMPPTTSNNMDGGFSILDPSVDPVVVSHTVSNSLKVTDYVLILGVSICGLFVLGLLVYVFSTVNDNGKPRILVAVGIISDSTDISDDSTVSLDEDEKENDDDDDDDNATQLMEP